MKLNARNFSSEDHRITWKVDSTSIRITKMVRNSLGEFVFGDMLGDYYGAEFFHKNYEECLRGLLTKASEKWGLELIKPEMQVA